MENKIIFNVEEVAKYLNCSISCIRTLVRKKEIPYFRIGNRLNFNKESIDIWIHNQEIQNLNLEKEEVKNYARKIY